MNRLPAAFAGVRVLDPDCVLPGLHCLPDQSNVVDVFFGVGSASECQLSCAYHTGRCRHRHIATQPDQDCCVYCGGVQVVHLV